MIEQTPEESRADGLRIVAKRNGEDRYQWGQYVERRDADGWTPLVYTGDEQSVREWHAEAPEFGWLRNSAVVRRAIGPWEVTPDA